MNGQECLLAQQRQAVVQERKEVGIEFEAELPLCVGDAGGGSERAGGKARVDAEETTEPAQAWIVGFYEQEADELEVVSDKGVRGEVIEDEAGCGEELIDERGVYDQIQTFGIS